MTVANVRIDATDPTDLAVEIEGERIRPESLGLYWQPREIPRLVIELPTGTVFEGVADVSIAAPASALHALEEILSGVDPDELGQRALDGMGFGDESTAQAILNELRRMVASYGT